MRPAVSLPIAVWANADRQRLLWKFLFLGASLALAGSLASNLLLLTREREVVRVGSDGLAALVTVDNQVYAEPAEHEIERFAATFAIFLMRRDSYSVANDWEFCGKFMTPELYQRFRAEAQGTRTQPGAVEIVEALRRRTNVPESSLEVVVDKRPYPWKARVKGVRKVVGQDGEEPFEVSLSLLRASRNKLIGGLVVEGIHTPGEPLARHMTVRPVGE